MRGRGLALAFAAVLVLLLWLSTLGQGGIERRLEAAAAPVTTGGGVPEHAADLRAPGEFAPRAPSPRRALDAPARAVASNPAAQVVPPADAPELLVCVFRDGDPLVGVTILDGRDEGIAEPEREAFFPLDPPARQRVLTDGEGCARFTELEPGTRALWLIEGAPSPVRFLAEVTRGTRSTCRVQLGSAALEGGVYESDGAPAARAHVLAIQHGTGGEAPLWFMACTDEEGAYALEALAGGADRRVAAMVVDRFVGDSQTTLAAGERRRLDFGSARGVVHLTGRLRFPSGVPFEGPEHLCFVGGEHTQTAFLGGHGFALDLPRDSYAIRLADAAGPVLATLDLAADRDVEWTVPGASLRGRITYVGTKHPLARGPEGDVRLELVHEDGRPCAARAFHSGNEFAFLALEPGRYTLRSRPWPLAGVPDGLRLDLVDECVRDLEITDP